MPVATTRLGIMDAFPQVASRAVPVPLRLVPCLNYVQVWLLLQIPLSASTAV